MRVADVSPSVANRVICHCDGCQTFARRMEPSILDERGGTERFQVSPASLSITSGGHALRCVQQSRRGAHRWYASCCNATFGLTLEGKGTPFVGLDARRVDLEEVGQPLDRVLGPVRARVNLKGAGRERRRLRADLRSLLAMLWHLAPLTARWWWRGDQRRLALRNPETGTPIVAVERLYDVPRLARAAGCR